MNILEIYKKYQIMPQLQEHQLTVAAVADFICEHFTPLPHPPRKGEGIRQVDRRDIVAACLLHDMGNIVKFDLSKTWELHPGLFVKQEDRDFWENVKMEAIKKYGTGSHNVTLKIVSELQASERIRELVDCVGFDQGVENSATEDFGKKICAYSDMRVMPAGVSSLEERMADLRVRYQNHPEGANNREVFEAALRKIEQQIFEHCNIAPSNITGQTVADKKEKLKSFEI
jgi:hypothetical protein